MDLADAQLLAGRFVALIAPQTEKVLIVGSIRRKRPTVNDVDVAVMSREEPDLFGFPRPTLHRRIRDLIHEGAVKARVKKDGKTMVGEDIACIEFEGFPVDVYYAKPHTWWGLVQVRTGSAEFNRMLATRALDRHMRYHGDGTGIWSGDELRRIDDGASEQSIFQALDLRYYEPEEREVEIP